MGLSRLSFRGAPDVASPESIVDGERGGWKTWISGSPLRGAPE